MKTRIIALFAFLAIAVSAQSQILRAGVNLANVTISGDGDIDEAKMLTSFQVGLLLNLKVAPFFSFQPGILFTGKGSKTESGQPTDANYFRATTNPYYVEIPANLIFKTPTGPIKLFVGAGPYLAMGIAGKNKVDGKFLGTSFHSENDIEFSNDDPSTLDYEEGAGYGIMKKFDYGLNAIGGIEMAHIVLSINYGLGLAKLQSGNGSGGDDKSKHRVLSFTVGVKL